MPKKPFFVPRVNLGVNSTDPPTAIPTGALRTGDNVTLFDGVLRSANGFTRVTNSLPRDHGYTLDGGQQHFWGRVDATDTVLKLTSNVDDAWTIELFFRMDAYPSDIATDMSPETAISVLAYKGGRDVHLASPGTDVLSDFNWAFLLFSEGGGGGSLGKVYVRFRINWDTSGVETLDNTNQEINVGTVYHAVALCDGTNVSLYVHEASSSIGTAQTGSTDHSSGGQNEEPSQTASDLYVGASPVGTRFTVLSAASVTFGGSNKKITIGSGAWSKTPEAGSVIHVDTGTPTGSGSGFFNVVSATTTVINTEETLPSSTVSVTITEFPTKTQDKKVHYGLRGAVQEIRIWTDERTTSELEANDDDQLTDTEADADSNLVYLQRLTGAATDGYYFSSYKGTAGPDSGEAPYLTLMPRDVTWRDSGHVLGSPTGGTYTLDFDGVAQSLSVPNGYLYRSSTVDDEGDLTFPDLWSVTFKCTPRVLNDRATVLCYVPVMTDEFGYHWLWDEDASSTGNPTSGSGTVTANLLVEILDTGSSTYEFRAVIVHKRGSGDLEFTSEESSIGGISAGTEYTVTVGVDASPEGQTLYLYVNGTSNSRTFYHSIESAASVTVTAATGVYALTANIVSADVDVGDEVYITGFANAGNNGLKVVTARDYASYTITVATNDLVDETATATIWNVGRLHSADDGEFQGARKYALSLGNAIWRSRQQAQFPGDPNGVDVWYDRQRSFDGELRQVMLAQPWQAWSFETLHNFNRTQTVDRDSVGKLGLQVRSCWVMDEGRGEVLEDIGGAGNSIEFREDPDHVWIQSLIDTNDRSAIQGLFDHRYTTASGNQNKFIAMAGGAAYSVNTGTGALTLFAEGFRNDDLNLISSIHFRDSMILCAGRGARGNYHLWKDQLWRLDIEPPSGFIPFGLTDQKNKEAKLTAGTYRIAFTFYSAYTGKESPVGPVIEFEIKSNRANLALGTKAEINQTYPTTGLCDNKEPWDMEASGSNGARFRVGAWIGTVYDDSGSTSDPGVTDGDPDWWEESPGDNTSDPNGPNSDKHAALKKVIFDRGPSAINPGKNALVDDEGAVTAEDFKAVVEDKAGEFVHVELDPVGKAEVRGNFAGSNAHLRIIDTATASNPDIISTSGVMDFGASASAGSVIFEDFTGTGEKNHGLRLPASNDPQVTHLRMYRTLANSTTLRFAEEVPNGTDGFVHYIPDEQLVGPVLDITIGQPPAVEYVADYAGRAIYVKDPDQPQRAYFSEPGQPWNVPAENVIDFLDGDTLALTGVGRTEGALMLFKDDTTFLLLPPPNSLVPFRVETRLRDIGCVSPFSVTNIQDSIFFCGEKGMYRYDTSFPEYLSRPIENIWQDNVSITNRDKIVGIHDRRNDAWLIAYPTGDVTVNSKVVNDRMLVLDYTVGRERDNRYGWTRLTNLSMSVAAIVADANDVDRVYFADPLGYIYQWDSGTNYGVGSLTDRTLTASAGGSTSVTVTQATLGSVPDGHKGFWITLVRAADSGRESRYVTADDLASPSVLTVDRAWTTNPVSGDSVLVGSIESDAIFGEFSPFGAHALHHMTETFVRASKQDTSSSAIKWQWQGLGGVDNSHQSQDPSFSSLLTEQSVSFSNQKVDMHFSTPARGRRLAVRVLSQGPDQPFAIRDFTLLIQPVQDGTRVSLT